MISGIFVRAVGSSDSTADSAREEGCGAGRLCCAGGRWEGACGGSEITTPSNFGAIDLGAALLAALGVAAALDAGALDEDTAEEDSSSGSMGIGGGGGSGIPSIRFAPLKLT